MNDHNEFEGMSTEEELAARMAAEQSEEELAARMAAEQSEDGFEEFGTEADDGAVAQPVEVDTGVTIDDDVPIPAVARRKYPFASMEPGQSFQVRLTSEALEKADGDIILAMQRLRSSLSSSATSFQKSHPQYKFIIRKTTPRTLRCWCTLANG